jgi:hypothetical protein
VDAGDFDERSFFRAVAHSRCRALLIGRRALVALGIPVLTADYDFWIHTDDAHALNAAVAPLGLSPTRTPEEARKVGRYVLENSEHVDVLVARACSTQDGVLVQFDEVWDRREVLAIAPGVDVWLPCLDDLILTKSFGNRGRDRDDIRLLHILRSKTRDA